MIRQYFPEVDETTVYGLAKMHPCKGEPGNGMHTMYEHYPYEMEWDGPCARFGTSGGPPEPLPYKLNFYNPKQQCANDRNPGKIKVCVVR